MPVILKYPESSSNVTFLHFFHFFGFFCRREMDQLNPDPTLIGNSVADPDPGSGAFLTPGSGIWNRFFPDTGSQIHIFESLVTIFWGKKYYNSLKICSNFFLFHFKNKIIFIFVIFVATKWCGTGRTTNFFPSSFVAVVVSAIRDPG